MSEAARRRSVAPGSFDHDGMVRTIKENGTEFKWIDRRNPGVRLTPADVPGDPGPDGELPKPVKDWVHVRPRSRTVLAYGDAEHPLLITQYPNENGQYPQSEIPGPVISEDVTFYTQHPDEPRILFVTDRKYNNTGGLAMDSLLEADAKAMLYKGNLDRSLGSRPWDVSPMRSGNFTTGEGTTVVNGVDLSDPTAIKYQESNYMCVNNPYAVIDAFNIPMPAAPTTTSGPELAAAA
jgi:hypothetical protein